MFSAYAKVSNIYAKHRFILRGVSAVISVHGEQFLHNKT